MIKRNRQAGLICTFLVGSVPLVVSVVAALGPLKWLAGPPDLFDDARQWMVYGGGQEGDHTAGSLAVLDAEKVEAAPRAKVGPTADGGGA